MSGVFGKDYARHYAALYEDKDYAAEAHYVLELIERYRAGAGRPIRLLELGCGTGQHAEHLARAGCEVACVERSPEMLRRAAERLAASPRVTLAEGDAASIRLGTCFDAVVALFHVLSYQIEDREVAALFDTAATHLEPGGLAILDFWHGPGVLADPPAVRVRRVKRDALSLLRIAEPAHDPARHEVRVDYTLMASEDGEATWRRVTESHRMRYFFPQELTSFQQAAGLTPLGYLPWMRPEGKPGAGDWNAVLVARR